MHRRSAGLTTKFGLGSRVSETATKAGREAKGHRPALRKVRPNRALRLPRKPTPRADWRARSLTTTFVALLLATGLQPAASAYAEAFVSRSESSKLDAASGWSSGGGTAIANLNGGPVDFVAIDLFSPEIRLPNRGAFGTGALCPVHGP